MWAALYNNFMPLTGLTVTVALLCLILQLMRVSYERRIFNLQLSSSLVDRFFDAAEKVVSDPAAPEIMKEFVDISERLIGDRELTQRMASNIIASRQNSSPDRQKKLNELYQVLARLKEQRPDLIHTFYIAINSAMAASLLRWKETAPAAITLYVDEQQQPEPTRVIKSVKYMSASDGLAKGGYCPA